VLGTQQLAERIGRSQARTLLLDGGDIDAATAATLGLASAVVTEDGLEAAVTAAAHRQQA